MEKTGKVRVEYGAMSSKFVIEADSKLTAYAGMCIHFGKHYNLIAIYAPEELRADSWLDPFGTMAAMKLAGLFGGEDKLEAYIEEHKAEIKDAVAGIRRLV